MYGSPARVRLEQRTARRSNVPVVITTVLSLLVVAAAVAAVAWLVFRTPSEAVDSAERLEPVGTALPAPTEQPSLPTPIPTEPSEPAVPGFTGEAPDVSALPTVAAPREAEAAPQDVGPTPTPRVLALPTEPAAALAPTLPPAQPTPLPAATLPPSVPVEAVPVVALEPVEAAQPAPAAARPDDNEEERGQRPVPVAVDDDPFNIFGDGDGNGSRIVPAQNDALDRARALQDEAGAEERDGSEPGDVPVIAPADVATITERRDGSVEIVVPDVDAMIEEITAQANDPNRNPNARDRNGNDRERQDDSRDRNDDNRDSNRSRAENGRSSGNRARSVRERINDRFGSGSTTRPDQDGNDPGSAPGNSGDDEDIGDECFPFCD